MSQKSTCWKCKRLIYGELYDDGEGIRYYKFHCLDCGAKWCETVRPSLLK